MGIILGRPAAGALLHRRRERAGRARPAAARRPACSRACCCSSCSPPTSWSATGCVPAPARRGDRRSMSTRDARSPIILTIVSAAHAAAARGARRARGRALRRAQPRRRRHDADRARSPASRVTSATGSSLLGIVAGDRSPACRLADLRLPDPDPGRQPGRDRPGADHLRPRALAR